MGCATTVLDDVRAQIAADDKVLAEAKARLRTVTAAAIDYNGALRTFESGSLKHRTVNQPVTDGDGGLVLDRRVHWRLGPEGEDEPPDDTVDEVRGLVGPIVRDRYPKARLGLSKRGLLVTFGQQLTDQDPTVDLVIALTRRAGDGLWIPNLKAHKWDASDPETHTALLTSGPATLRLTRARIIRLLKAWNKQYSVPGLSSFHLEALALEAVEAGQGLATGLAATFDHAATFLATGANTPDPAGVSKNLRLLVDRATAVRRLRKAADKVAAALDKGDDEAAVRDALADVYWNYLEPASDGAASRSAVAALRSGRSVTTTTLGVGGPAAIVRPSRAYGQYRS